ncbi:MAG: diacylglycerol kinase family protein [Puia sp.]|nr:diacylglycerol kinase family protein [Puia sp.]
MDRQKFSVRKRIKSFQYAFSGIGQFLQSEHNGRIHLVATILVIAIALLLKVSFVEATVLTITVGFVWMAEMFNTCVEKTMDLISSEQRKEIKFIKDVAAGAVLVAAISALLIGLFIFIPKIV